MTNAGFGRAASVFRVRGFGWWFGSQALSGSGTNTQGVAMAWLVLQISGSGAALGALSVASATPILVLGAWAGSIADRWPLRRLLSCTQLAFVILSGLLATWSLISTPPLWFVLLVALLTGSVVAIDGPARQLYSFDLVGPDGLSSAISLNEVVINLSRVLGPALGGVLLGLAGPGWCFAVNTASYLPVLIAVRLLRPDGSQPARIRPAVTPRPIRAGLRYVAAIPYLWACLLMAGALGMVFNTTVALPLLNSRVFGQDAGTYGAMVTAFGLGAVPGAVMAARARPRPRTRWLRLLGLSTGIAVLVTAFAPSLGLVFVGLGLTGFLSIWCVSRVNTAALLRADRAMRGRVMGIWTMALPGSAPLTGMVTGILADTSGPRIAYALSGLLLIAVVIFAGRWFGQDARSPAA